VTPLAELTALEVAAGRRRLVGPVDLRVEDGERVGVVGPSGSGKSLTVAALLGDLPPGTRATGRARVAGVDLLDALPRDLAALRGRVTAAVVQDSATALDPLARVGHQVGLPARRVRGLSRTTARAETLDLLGRLGFADPAAVAGAWPAQLSGGQRQRVSLAVALAARPRLLVADEPTTALDTVAQATVLRLLGAVLDAPGAPALVLVSHDLAVVAQLCDRVVVLAGGRVVEAAPTATLLAAPQHPVTRSLVAAARAAEPATGVGA